MIIDSCFSENGACVVPDLELREMGPGERGGSTCSSAGA